MNLQNYQIQNLEKLKHTELLSFYNRVELFCDKLMTSLAQNISNDLYVFFKELKLNKITEELALRITKDESLTLIEKLKLKH